MSSDLNETPDALNMQWLPGPARGCNRDWEFQAGESYLVAVMAGITATGEREVDIAIVVTQVCEEGAEFVDGYGDSWAAWEWSDVDWFLPLGPVVERLLTVEESNAE
jgi:hypothetical protein